MVIIAKDIRERKKTEEAIKGYIKQLEASEIELKELNHSKDKFFSIIAHDLKNPFGSVLGYSEILAEDCEELSPAELKEFSGNLHQQAKAIYDLLENLLTWSRMQTGRMVYEPELLMLGGIVEKVIDLYTSKAESKSIALVQNGTQDKRIWADDNMMFTVIRNLVSNALKFTPNGGKIEINASDEGSKLRVEVKDSGIGISEEDQKKLFRIDVQHSTIGTGQEKGTGLGLILCKDLVEKNGGQIGIESKLNEGTTFYFTVPKSPN